MNIWISVTPHLAASLIAYFTSSRPLSLIIYLATNGIRFYFRSNEFTFLCLIFIINNYSASFYLILDILTIHFGINCCAWRIKVYHIYTVIKLGGIFVKNEKFIKTLLWLATPRVSFSYLSSTKIAINRKYKDLLRLGCNKKILNFDSFFGMEKKMFQFGLTSFWIYAF